MRVLDGCGPAPGRAILSVSDIAGGSHHTPALIRITRISAKSTFWICKIGFFESS